MEGKVCTKCSEWKEIEEFPREMNKGKMIYRADCKKCRNAYKLELKKKNPVYKESQKKATQLWLKSPQGKEWNRERGKLNRQQPQWKIYQKKGRENYRSSEKGKATELAYAEANRDRNILRGREYRKTEHYKQLYKRWLQSEKGKQIGYYHRLKRLSYKHKVRFSPFERKQILDRDKWKCQNCGIKVHDRSTGNWNTPDKAHIDHIIPITKGGNSEPSNLQTLCRTCNLSKKDKIELQLSFFKE